MRSTLALALLATFVPLARPDEPPDGPRSREIRLVKLRVQLLGNMKRAERVAALQQLMLVRPPAVELVPDLLVAMADADEFVRSYAALALLAVDQRRSKEALAVLDPLFADPKKPPAVLRETSLWLDLAQVRPAHPDLVAGLLALMRGDHPLGQAAANRALQYLDPGARDAAPVLRAALTDPLPRIRLVAAEGLALVAPTDKARAVATLAELSTGKEKAVRGKAALALIRLDRASADQGVRVLRSLLLDPAPTGGRALARSFLELEPGQADVVVPVLALGLADRDPKARLTALEDLAFCGRLAAPQERALGRCLGDPDPQVARAAAETLLLARPQRGLDLLPAVFGADIDAETRKMAEALMQSLATPEGRELAVLNWAKAAEEKDRSRYGRRDAVNRLVALAHLASHGPAAAGAVAPLTRLLTSLSDPENRRGEILGELLAAQTVYALGRIGPQAAPAVPVLLQLALAPGSPPALRVEAAAALKQIDPDAAARADLP